VQLGVSQVSEQCLGKGAIANMGFESDPLEKFLKFHVKINALWSDWQTVKSYGFHYYCTEMQSATNAKYLSLVLYNFGLGINRISVP